MSGLRDELAALADEAASCFCGPQQREDHDPRQRDCPQHGSDDCKHIWEWAQTRLTALLDRFPPEAEGAAGVESDRDRAVAELQRIRELANPTGDHEALLGEMVYAVMDGTCDLADRMPPQSAFDDVRSDLEYALPVIRTAIAAALAASPEEQD